MIVFTDNAFVGPQYYTPGMVAALGSVLESELINDGVAVDLAVVIANVEHAITADSATSATTAGHATTADSASTADTATTALTASSATTALTAGSATTAGHATTADDATNADQAAALYVDSILYVPALYKPAETISSSAVSASCASTAVDEVLASFTIPAGTLGPNSILQIEPLWTFGSSANNKILSIKIAGVIVYTNTRTTTTKEGPLIILANRNALNSQVQPYANNYVAGVTETLTTYTIDFSVNVTVAIIGQRANSGDALTLQYYRCVHYSGD